MSHAMSVRRSVLGIPGNERQLVSGAMESEADEIFFDLEDSLGPGKKCCHMRPPVPGCSLSVVHTLTTIRRSSHRPAGMSAPSDTTAR